MPADEAPVSVPVKSPNAPARKRAPSAVSALRNSGGRPAKPGRLPIVPPIQHPEFDAHEQVLAHFDPDTGLSAIIAIHSTARGPAIGGCRMKPYTSTADALNDVLRLSKGMSYKCAMIKLPMGGAKSVIIGDPASAKSPKLVQAFAERVQAMGGAYWTAEDADINTADIAIMAWRTKYVIGRDEGPAPSGNPAPVTARGVILGIEAAVQEALGGDLKGRRISILGVGDVGRRVAELAANKGASVVVADMKQDRAETLVQKIDARVVAVEQLWRDETDVFCPCTLGASITVERANTLNAKIVAGAENNQLEKSAAGDALHQRGVLYAPDYVINAGGLINCYAEVVAVENKIPFNAQWVDEKLNDIAANLHDVFKLARDSKTPTHRVADEEARRRIGR